MINYKKGKNVEEELTKDAIPIENLPQNYLWMHVSVFFLILLIVDATTYNCVSITFSINFMLTKNVNLQQKCGFELSEIFKYEIEGQNYKLIFN